MSGNTTIEISVFSYVDRLSDLSLLSHRTAREKKKVKLGSKDKGNPITGHEGPDRGGWSAPRPGRFFPVKDPVPIV